MYCKRLRGLVDRPPKSELQKSRRDMIKAWIILSASGHDRKGLIHAMLRR